MKPKCSVLLLATMATLVGCTLTQPTLRNGDVPPTVGGGSKLASPKRCVLTLRLATRPMDDPALRDEVWRAADLQAVSDVARQALAANGVRIGVITGDLPGQVQAVLDAPPPKKVDPMTLVLSDGDGLGVPLGESTPHLDLMLSRQGNIVGKVYKDAKGQLRLTASQADDDGVKVRIVPELHHGPVRQGWEAAPGGGAFAPHSFVAKNGQEEESFRELAAELNLRPGQVAVLGPVADRPGSLGAFLFTSSEGTSDRIVQKVLFVWANRSDAASLPGPQAPTPPASLREVDPPDMPARP